MMERKLVSYNKIIIGISFFLAAILFCNSDMITVAQWGLQLLDCVKEGTIREYALILKDRGIITNYPIITNLITAVWLAPVYILKEICKLQFDIVVYTSWYKVLVLIVNVISVIVFNDVLNKLGYDADKKIWGDINYLLTPLVMLAIVAGGQVDGIGNLFLLMSFNYLLDNKYNKFAICAGLSICIKGLSVFVIIPWLILLLSKNKLSNIYGAMDGYYGINAWKCHRILNMLFPFKFRICNKRTDY